MSDINSSLEAIKNRLEGLESTSEGDSAKLNSTAKKLDELIRNGSSDLGSKKHNVCWFTN